MTKKVLVTGASGFIGSFLVEEFISNQYDVWAGIRSSSSKQNLQNPSIHFFEMDFSNKDSLKKQIRTFCQSNGKFDYVIHNAGATKCLKNKDFDKINFQNTANLIDALKQPGCNPLKFILMSSLSVMGVGDETNLTPFCNKQVAQPNTAYGRSKLKAEQYLKQSGLNFDILRPTGVYGPREKDYFMMIKTIKKGIDLSVGYATQYLTFIYVKDLARIARLAAESKVSNKTYLISDGQTYTGQEFTDLIKKIIAKNKTFKIIIPLWLLKMIALICELTSQITGKAATINRDKYKIMKQRNWKCETNDLVADLNYKPEYDLKKGLQETIEWYRVNGWL